MSHVIAVLEVFKEIEEETHPLIAKALDFATERHEGQFRKLGIGPKGEELTEPYVEHVKRVSDMVKRAGFDHHVQAAALLHDTVEDTPTSHEEILKHFGPQVHQMVHDLTDVPPTPGLNRAKRHQMNVERLSKAGYDTQSIKYADTIDNAPSLKQVKPDFYPLFVKEKTHLLAHMNNGHPELYKKAKGAVGIEEGQVMYARSVLEDGYEKALKIGDIKKIGKNPITVVYKGKGHSGEDLWGSDILKHIPADWPPKSKEGQPEVSVSTDDYMAKSPLHRLKRKK
jgi:guanosine-3',5'-bis(diphosphate) 3'-pyrophosphohydrolase